MAVDQETFDALLSEETGAIGQLITAVDALLASQPAGVDLSAEAQAVTDARDRIVAEVEKLGAPAPAPGDGPLEVPEGEHAQQ